jgi:hypothetical protein
MKGRTWETVAEVTEICTSETLFVYTHLAELTQHFIAYF